VSVDVRAHAVRELLLSVLIFMPLIWAVVVTLVAWRFIAQRTLFFVLAVLVLLGLQSIIAPAAISVLLPQGGGLTRATANEAFFQAAISGAVFGVVAGSLILWWLSRALRKP
jgi:hypothetical protein